MTTGPTVLPIYLHAGTASKGVELASSGTGTFRQVFRDIAAKMNPSVVLLATERDPALNRAAVPAGVLRLLDSFPAPTLVMDLHGDIVFGNTAFHVFASERAPAVIPPLCDEDLTEIGSSRADRISASEGISSLQSWLNLEWDFDKRGIGITADSRLLH